MSNVAAQFLFDFGSPNAYLCHRVLRDIEWRTGTTIEYVPILLGGLFKLTNNRSPAEAFAGIPNKQAYDALEVQRFLAKHKLSSFQRNEFFPVNTLLIMRGAVASQKLGCFDAYVEAVFSCMWEQSLNMADLEVAKNALSAAGLGDIGSHFCDLLEYTTGQRIARLVAQTATINAERTGADGRPAPVRTEDAVTLQYETDGGALGSAVISQVSAGHKNRLFLEISGSESTLAFDQEGPETLWEGRRDTSRLLIRNPEALTPEAARFSRLPAGHPQGYQDCFDALVGDTAAAITGRTPDGLPTFADGLRAAHLAEAVARSARTGTWVEVEA